MKELKIWLFAIASGLITASIITGCTQAYADSIQNEIASNVIRFHVLAHSNTALDQEIKDIVRDGILDRFGSKLDPTTNSIEDTRTFLLENLDGIQEYAAVIVKEHGLGYPVETKMGRVFFPTRTYGSMSFPAGEYEALRIIIGEGSGGNWWCVMFPPLCYVDAPANGPDTEPDYSGGDYSLLSTLLSREAYALMNHSQRDTGVTVRFKVVEWWQERMYDPAPVFTALNPIPSQ